MAHHENIIIYKKDIHFSGYKIYSYLFPVFTLQHDTIAPTYAWISPKQYSILTTDTVRICIDAHDNTNGSGIDKVVFYAKYFTNTGVFTQKHVIGEDYTAPYEYLWDCSDIPDQNLTKLVLYCEVIDKAGNIQHIAENIIKNEYFGLEFVLDRNSLIKTKTFHSRFTEEEIVIDGNLDEWAREDSITFANNDNKIVVYSMWCKKNLYFGITVYDRSFISNFGPYADMTLDLYREDIIEIFLDTNHDHHEILLSPDKHISVSPAGNKLFTERKIKLTDPPNNGYVSEFDDSIYSRCAIQCNGTLNKRA